jgi:hypothetical protein
MDFDLRTYLSPKVLTGALAVAALLLISTCVWISWSAPQPASDVMAVLTLIPAPTGTPAPLATATIDPNAPTATLTAIPGALAVGSYVQIKGTQGQGLRIRSAPGLNGGQLFLGYDEEVFVIKDGPRNVDGYYWYQLVAPYDSTRTGWAASDFLNIIPPPTH